MEIDMNVLMWCITHLCPTKNDLVIKEIQTKGASLRTQYVTLFHPKASGSGNKDVTSRQRGILNSLEFGLNVSLLSTQPQRF